jgi:hypothetical protein
MTAPGDPINPDVNSYCWHEDGWEAAGEWSVQDARHTTRGQAAARFASGDYFGDIRMVRAWKRYVRPLTRQDAWDYSGADREVDRLMCREGIDVKWQEDRKGQPDEWVYVKADTGERVPKPLVPREPPADWQPDPEGDPVWEFVHRSHPDAIPVWICAERGSSVPDNPQPLPVGSVAA